MPPLVLYLGDGIFRYPGYMDSHSECEWNMCFWSERRFSINKNYCEWKYSWIELSIGDPPLIVNSRLRGVQALEKSRDPYKQNPLVQTGHLNQAINLQLTTWPGKNVSPPNTELFNTYDNHIIISFNPRKIQLCTCRFPSLLIYSQTGQSFRKELNTFPNNMFLRRFSAKVHDGRPGVCWLFVRIPEVTANGWGIAASFSHMNVNTAAIGCSASLLVRPVGSVCLYVCSWVWKVKVMEKVPTSEKGW